MIIDFKENPQLDAQLMVVAKQTHDQPDPIAAYTEAVAKLGLSREEALMRGLWYLNLTKPEYRDKVRIELKKLDPDYCDLGQGGRRVKDVVIDGQEATMIHLPELEENVDLPELGLAATPEMREFLNQLAESAIEKSPLAQPYIDAGAIQVRVSKLGPGIEAHRVAFHKTKFAQMMKSPASFMN
jgi:hypothetical protein